MKFEDLEDNKTIVYFILPWQYNDVRRKVISFLDSLKLHYKTYNYDFILENGTKIIFRNVNFPDLLRGMSADKIYVPTTMLTDYVKYNIVLPSLARKNGILEEI